MIKSKMTLDDKIKFDEIEDEQKMAAEKMSAMNESLPENSTSQTSEASDTLPQSPDEGPPTRLEHEVATTKVLEKETGEPKQDTQQLQGKMNKEDSMNVRDASYLKSLYSKMVKYSTQYTSAENGSEDKEVNNLRNALDKWISKTENRISKTEEALGDKLEGLDKDHDGIFFCSTTIH